MIDKEKLLKALKGKMLSFNCAEIIKNFPEEPEQLIDFDALYKEWKEIDSIHECLDCPLSNLHSGDTTIDCFVQFLKSKNITAQKPFEIPVKRTWTLKKEYVNFFKKMINQTCTLKVKTIEQPEHEEFYDLHEEPDYSKIPNWSIVELVNKDTKRRHVFIMKECCNGEMFDTEGLSYTMGLYNVRIVELAKE